MTTYSKEHEALFQFPVLQLDSSSWWSSVGSLATQSHNTDSSAQLKSTEAKQTKLGAVGAYNGIGIKTHVPGSWDGQKTQPHPAAPMYSALPADYRTWVEIGYSPSMIFQTYPYADPSYSLLSACGPQIGGRIMLPLSLTPDEGPVFVNAKQYHGIIRRRQSRAKAELLNKPSHGVRKKYLHESRHLHAKRRARGAGGRFLNTIKTLNNEPSKQKDAHGMYKDGNLAQPTGSQNSEILQSDINGGNPAASATEVASSVYSNNFHGDHFGFSFNIGIPQPSPMDTTPAVKWTDYFNLKI